jgi:hypothetical protein
VRLASVSASARDPLRSFRRHDVYYRWVKISLAKSGEAVYWTLVQ